MHFTFRAERVKEAFLSFFLDKELLWEESVVKATCDREPLYRRLGRCVSLVKQYDAD